MPLSFRDYIKRRRITDTPMGDFVADFKSDRAASDVESWDQLEFYLMNRGACDEAIVAAKKVWRGYLSFRRTAP